MPFKPESPLRIRGIRAVGWFIRGALVEYGSDFMGPVPNIVAFQFNPETISRTINFPPDTTATQENTGQEEPHQISSSPYETFSITANFSAADDLGGSAAQQIIPRMFGVGPQLAALEKMVYADGGIISDAIGAAVDAIGDALGLGSDEEATAPVPRQETPRILFIWGPSRVLPVKINSMTIDEEKYDPLLNPVQAKVTIGLSVLSFPEATDDAVGMGALRYTQTLKDAQAVLNLVKVAEATIDTVPF